MSLLLWVALGQAWGQTPPSYFDDADGDGVPDVFDCEPYNNSIYPGALEVAGDGIDQDCDGFDDCYVDNDDDGYGSATNDPFGSTTLNCDTQPGASSNSADCDDSDAAINPTGNDLPGDSFDQDCDGLLSCWLDFDYDGYGGTQFSGVSPGGFCDNITFFYTAVATDCDDTDESVHPTAPETIADGIDQDCDGSELCYEDDDNDGFGNDRGDTTLGGLECNGEGLSGSTDDCNDANASINPVATELIVDGIDSNCDGLELCYQDNDNDTYGSSNTTTSTVFTCDDAGRSSNNFDCDDGDGGVSPAATEVVVDGIDQNCDGQELCYVDGDGDTFGHQSATALSPDLACDSEGVSSDSDDCNDGVAAINPSAAEIPVDGVDQNCDGLEICYQDNDLDQVGTPVTTVGDVGCSNPGTSSVDDDCDDNDPTIYPGAVEIVADGIDQDCNGADLVGCYQDLDLDGFGDSDTIVYAGDCSLAGLSAIAADCDDGDAGINPGAFEIIADGIDQDCDALDACYVDNDLDGVGSSNITAGAFGCDDPGLSDRSDDCDDNSDQIAPTLAEAPCNGVDEDCDGLADDDPDDDSDGYRFCIDDCDDSNALVNPGQTEVPCNVIDDDCNPGSIDGVDADGDGVALCANDCDDNNPYISPLLDETPCNGVNDDCDAKTIDEPDDDVDGFTVCNGDCDDTDPLVNPGLPEQPCNGVDDDCNPASLDDQYCLDTSDTGAVVTADTGTLITLLPTGDTGATAGTGDTAEPTDTDDPETVGPNGQTTTPTGPGKAAPTGEPDYGCGCRGAPSSAGWWLLLPLLWGRRR